MSFLNPLYQAVAYLLVHIHTGVHHVISNSGWSWALSIILLTIGMRLVLFPLFVKQIRNQRAMQTIQPKMKELQAKYKNDKEKLNQEMMALWREAGANPFSGCLPLLLQIPIFVALFHTLRDIKPADSSCNTHLLSCFHGQPGFPQADVFSAAHAKIFSVPISVSFSTAHHTITALGSTVGATRILAIILTVIMGATTFITQRQLMARNGPAADSTMAQQQKIMLYIFPLMFLFYGFKFPIGVLLYWLTTNLWSMGQQAVVIKRMEEVPEGPAASAPAGPAPGAKPKLPPKGANKPAPAGPPPGAKPSIPKPSTPNSPTPKPAGSGTGGISLPPGGAIGATPPPRPSGNNRPTNRSNKRKKRGRR